MEVNILDTNRISHEFKTAGAPDSLGAGFAFVGRKVHLDIEGEDFYSYETASFRLTSFHLDGTKTFIWPNHKPSNGRNF